MGEQHFNFLAQSSRDAAFPRACDLACHVTGAFADRSQAMLIAARSSKPTRLLLTGDGDGGKERVLRGRGVRGIVL
jgi:hypothetical protein